MDILMGAHIGGGGVALVAGALAIFARKGGRLHARAGIIFAFAMLWLWLWLSATALHLRDGKVDSAVGDLFIGYFVVTAWLAARRRDGTTGRLEIVACAVIFATGGLIAWGALAGTARPTPVGMGPVYVIAAFCLAAGLLDLHAILRPRLAPTRRIARHLWRMCSAFFIATGSFFLGQQDVLPEALRGSPILLALAFAPFAALAFWMIRLRFGKRLKAAVQALSGQAAA